MLFGNDPVAWSLGPVHYLESDVNTLSQFVADHLSSTDSDAWLFWDQTLGEPDEANIMALLHRRVDVWHAGLSLGMGSLPAIMDFASPTWVFNRDPDAAIEATSWRLSLRACLVKVDVIREMGFINPNFSSLAAAALELGYRYLRYGVILRHSPALLTKQVGDGPVELGFQDELLFIHLGQGRRIKYWALSRATMTGHVSFFGALRSLKQIRRVPVEEYQPFSCNQTSLEAFVLPEQNYEVTVLIPTLDRYPYLRELLGQLRTQSIKPLEIIIVDQTEKDLRDTGIPSEFGDLPLRMIYQDSPGQCSSRNAGLEIARGEYVLFLDDDDEVKDDVIERHLKNLFLFDADTSSGGVDEVGALPLSGIFTRTRLSDVFPTNNTLIRKSVLCASGLFDMAYNRGQSADGDLGMRIYLSGALMMYNPQISVLHHRAPRGGLRQHKARVITYASSRMKLLHRRFPHITEVYRQKRYYTPHQVREALRLAAAGTFSIHGSGWRRFLKVLIAILLLPNTIYQLRYRRKQAEEMMRVYPQIPEL